jgi:thiamine biosynthesis protein ThiS
VIAVQINGKRVELDGPTRLAAYLERLRVDPRAVAVEHNGEIVERAGFPDVVFQDGDVVEIVRMVGGGSEPGSAPRGEPLPDRGLGLGSFVPGF